MSDKVRSEIEQDQLRALKRLGADADAVALADGFGFGGGEIGVPVGGNQATDRRLHGTGLEPFA